MDKFNKSNDLDRLTKRIVQSAPIPDMHPNFSDMVMRKIAPAKEHALLEKCLTAFFLVLAIITVAASVFGSASIISTVLVPLKDAPWLLVLTAVSLLLVIKLFEMQGDSDRFQSN